MFFRLEELVPKVGACFTDALDGAEDSARRLDLAEPNAGSLAAVTENYRRVMGAAGFGSLVTMHHEHGAKVVRIDSKPPAGFHLGAPAGFSLPVGDAMITDLVGVAIGVRYADCLPVLFSDAKGSWVGAAHAGRRGLLSGVLPATVAALRDVGASELRAWLGPAICGSCYEVSETMHTQALQELPESASKTRIGTPAIDLVAGAKAQLAAAEVPAIDWSVCTLESYFLHSHRRDAERSGRMIAAIWRK